MTDIANLAASCRNCMFWRSGHPPIATALRHAAPNPDLGVCESLPPTVHILAGIPTTLFPEVHATRCCWDWVPDDGADDSPRRGKQRSADILNFPGAA